MRRMEKIVRVLFFGLLLTGLSFSCNKSELNPSPNSKAKIKADEIYYKSLMSSRTTYKGESFEILDVKREGQILKITVEGPCDENGYEVVWDGIINFIEPTFSVPMTVNLAVAYKAVSQIQCLAIMKHTIELDLVKVVGEKEYRKDMNVKVSNASKVDDKLVDSKGTVSNNNSQITDKTTKDEDLKYLEKLLIEINQLAKNDKCTAENKFLLTEIGSKACGGPLFYIIYDSSIDKNNFLAKVSFYTSETKAFNIKHGVISDCSIMAGPNSVACKDGKPILVY
jgi:hypothetical protein